MKRRLNRIKGKRLVTGDPNLMTKDEICINATPNGVEVKEIGTDGGIKDIASGGGEGEGGSNIEYFVYNSNSLPILVMAGVSQLLKASIQVQSQDNIIQVIAAGPNMYVFEKLQTTGPEMLAIGVDLNTKFAVKNIDGSNEMFVLLDLLLESFTKEEIAALPRITKEEFYNLEA